MLNIKIYISRINLKLSKLIRKIGFSKSLNTYNERKKHLLKRTYFSASQAIICFIACHLGSADHFATFVQNLTDDFKTVEIFASGHALKKFQERGIEVKNPFSIDNISIEDEDSLADQIAQKCSAYSVVITDVGHTFNIKLQKAIAKRAAKVHRLAYYDNPETYVPGGYSKVSSQVMLAAQGVLFANFNLANSAIFEEPSKEIYFGNIDKIGIGYYPISNVEKIAKRRQIEQASLRTQLFLKNNLRDTDQKIMVYFGGNNDEYFGKAFPAFLILLKEGMQNLDFSNLVFIIQQHPGAKSKNLDVSMVFDWISKYGNSRNAPKFIISDFSSDDAQVIADCAFYYQTSMGPQFVLAGIPTIQIGHEPFQDILVKNHLSPSVTTSDHFLKVIQNLDHQKKEIPQEIILESLGIKKDWPQILIHALCNKAEFTQKTPTEL